MDCFLIILLGCKSKPIEPYNPIRDIPKEIKEKYVIPLVGNEETALGIAKLIIKERYKDVNIDSLTLEKIELVSEEKVWEIVLKTPNAGFGLIFNIRINKNDDSNLEMLFDKDNYLSYNNIYYRLNYITFSKDSSHTYNDDNTVLELYMVH